MRVSAVAIPAAAIDVWGTDRDDLDVAYLVRLKVTSP
jgi:hypothetical protein